MRALVDGLADIGVFAENTPADGLDVRAVPDRRAGADLCARQHRAGRAASVSISRRCLAHDFVGLNRGSSLLELTSRAAEQAGLPLRLRVQVRSFDAMCHMVAAGLGIGVVPLAACSAQVSVLDLRVVRLKDAWAVRRLLMATKTGEAAVAGRGPAAAAPRGLGRRPPARCGTRGRRAPLSAREERNMQRLWCVPHGVGIGELG